VISTGAYAIVRQPVYCGTSRLYIATPLALGSWWALLSALAFIPVFARRIRNEADVFVRELAN
jgi:protein-S-isoprenylcysteine O-methyltransferase Ste14